MDQIGFVFLLFSYLGINMLIFLKLSDFQCLKLVAAPEEMAKYS